MATGRWSRWRRNRRRSRWSRSKRSLPTSRSGIGSSARGTQNPYTSRTLCRLNSRAVSRVGIDSLSFRKELVRRVIHFIGINCSSQILVIFEKSLKLLSERYIPPWTSIIRLLVFTRVQFYASLPDNNFWCLSIITRQWEEIILI